jgi:hypothetical protein
MPIFETIRRAMGVAAAMVLIELADDPLAFFGSSGRVPRLSDRLRWAGATPARRVQRCG